MIEIPRIVQQALTERIEYNTSQFLRKHNIHILSVGDTPKNGIVVANHPTIWDSIYWREVLPNGFHAVHEKALEKTPVSALNRWFAIYGSHMIPVHSGNSDERRKTYANIITWSQQSLVIFNPTGETTFDNAVPEQEDLVVNGLVRMVQNAHEANMSLSILPAYIQVRGEILQDGTIEDGTSVLCNMTTQQLHLPITQTGEQDCRPIQKAIHEAWEQLFTPEYQPTCEAA